MWSSADVRELTWHVFFNLCKDGCQPHGNLYFDDVINQDGGESHGDILKYLSSWYVVFKNKILVIQFYNEVERAICWHENPLSQEAQKMPFYSTKISEGAFSFSFSFSFFKCLQFPLSQSLSFLLPTFSYVHPVNWLHVLPLDPWLKKLLGKKLRGRAEPHHNNLFTMNRKLLA